MRRLFTIVLGLTIASATLFADSWPQWRGPSLDGVSTETGLPHRWSPTENVAWKLPLPAFSGSTPIIWDDLIFLNVALQRATGNLEEAVAVLRRFADAGDVEAGRELAALLREQGNLDELRRRADAGDQAADMEWVGLLRERKPQ